MRQWLGALPPLVIPMVLAAQQRTDTVTLAPVVVTATRLPTRADALSASVTVISGAQLRAQGLRTVAEALRTVPAAAVVTTGPWGGQTSLFLRGGESDYVKVLIDGVPQNALGGSYDFANLTTDNVERIEVVRGPTSVLYGSDAVTGVVQIFTRDGRGAPHATVAFGGGTYATNAVHVTASGGDDRAGYAVGLSRFASDGIYRFNNEYRNQVLSGRVRLRPDAHTDAALSVRYGNALYHFPTDGSGNPVSHNQRQLDRGPSVGLDVGHVFSDHVESHVTGTWHRDNAQYAIAPNGPSDTTTFPFSSSDWVTRSGLDGRTNVRLSGGEVVTVGGAFEHEAMQGSTLNGSRSRDDGAAYLQLVTDLERPLSLTLGARVDDNQRFSTYATYRAGLSFRVNGNMRAIASVGTGFKEPNFFENYATGFVRGNPGLQPEHSFTWETGLEHHLPGAGVTVRATYFNQRFRDLIDYNGSSSVKYNYFNVPGADARGLEVASEAAPGGALRVTAAYTFLDTRVTRGGPDTGSTALFLAGQSLIRRPWHSATLGLSYRLGRRGSVMLTALYTGRRPDVDYRTFRRDTLPSYTRVDVAGQLDLLRPQRGAPGLAVVGRVENLFDRSYQEVTNFPARRRNVFLGGELRFGTP
jgi:vitamin B12 transporter